MRKKAIYSFCDSNSTRQQIYYVDDDGSPETAAYYFWKMYLRIADDVYHPARAMRNRYSHLGTRFTEAVISTLGSGIDQISEVPNHTNYYYEMEGQETLTVNKAVEGKEGEFEEIFKGHYANFINDKGKKMVMDGHGNTIKLYEVSDELVKQSIGMPKYLPLYLLDSIRDYYASERNLLKKDFESGESEFGEELYKDMKKSFEHRVFLCEKEISRIETL